MKVKPLYTIVAGEKRILTAPSNVDPVVRLKSPLKGSTAIDDLVQGRVEVKMNNWMIL